MSQVLSRSDIGSHVLASARVIVKCNTYKCYMVTVSNTMSLHPCLFMSLPAPTLFVFWAAPV